MDYLHVRLFKDLIYFRTTAPPAFGTGSITFGTPATQAPLTFGLNTSQPLQPATGSFSFGSTPSATNTAAPSSFGTQATLNLNKPTGFAAPTTQPGLLGATSTASVGGFQFGKHVTKIYF